MEIETDFLKMLIESGALNPDHPFYAVAKDATEPEPVAKELVEEEEPAQPAPAPEPGAGIKIAKLTSEDRALLQDLMDTGTSGYLFKEDGRRIVYYAETQKLAVYNDGEALPDEAMAVIMGAEEKDTVIDFSNAPTCKFYSPTYPMVEAGAEMSDAYEYDRADVKPTCSCATMNQYGYTHCKYVSNQPVCEFYEPSKTQFHSKTRLKKKGPGFPGSIRELSLESTRIGLSAFRCYDVYATDSADLEGKVLAEPQLLHRVSSEEYGKDALTVAEQLFNEEIAAFGDAFQTQLEVVNEEPQVESFLKELVS